MKLALHPVGLVGRVRPYAQWALLLAVALLPRLWQLDRFITPDEILFLDQARQFLEGLAGGDLSLTLGIGYPGISLAWANALGLLALFGLSRLGLADVPAGPYASLNQFLAAADSQPLPYYVAGRVVTSLLITGLLLVFYALACRLFSSQGHRPDHVALLGGLLLALDPFVLGYSRLMHIEAPLALLMLLAVLSWMLWIKQGRRRWIGLAGLFCGLAILTKTTALLLIPIMLGLALLRPSIKYRPNIKYQTPALTPPSGPLGGRSGASVTNDKNSKPGSAFTFVIGHLIFDIYHLIFVLGIAALVFYVLWPAMWRAPGQALGLSLGKLWVDKEAGEGNLGMFWLGRFVQDPGPAFYPVALLLKLSPLMLVGLVVNLLSLRPQRGRYAEWGLWVYALLYLLVMALASKKSVRYMLPAFAAFAPLAAYGLLRLGRWAVRALNAEPTRTYGEAARSGCGAGETRKSSVALWFGLAVLLLAFSLPYAPYYLSYYNPLLIGWRWAPQTMLIGWGEGLDDAARYLNGRLGGENATVTAWYDWTFAPFFRGQTLPFSTENALRSDYSVLYVNQVQRNIPDPNLITYFQRRRPDYVVRLNGVDYAWVYPAISRAGPPPATALPLDVPMGDAVVLESYEVRPAVEGQGLIVTLFWRPLRSDLADYYVYVRAVDGAGQIHARADSPPVMGFWPTSRWEAGELVSDEQVLLPPPETQSGPYRLEVGMYDPQTWAVLEPARGERGEGGGLLLGEVRFP